MAHNFLDLGSGGVSGSEYGFPETLLQVTHFLSKLTCQILGIQHYCHRTVNTLLMTPP